MNRKILFILYLILNLNLFSQTLKYNRIYELSPSFGSEWMNLDPINDKDWLNLTEGYNSDELIDSTYENDIKYRDINFQPVASLSFTMGLKKAKEAENAMFTPLLRFSLNTSTGYHDQISFSKEEIFTYDSLLQASNGNVTYLDSTINTYYSKTYNSRATNFSTSILFQSNRNRMISFYLGLGLGFGMGTNSSANVSLTQDLSVDYGYDDSEYYEDELLYSKSYDLKNYFIYHFNVPVGIDIRLYNKDNFFSRSILSVEGQFGANWMQIPEIGTLQNTNFRLTFAYKYRF